MRDDEKGLIIVEFIFSFMLLVLLITSILSLVNIVTLQSRIHYAMTQTANTISMYSYILDVTGFAEDFKTNRRIANKTERDYIDIKNDIDGVLDGIMNISPSDVGTHGESLAGHVNNIADDPKAALSGLANYVISEGMDLAAARLLIQPLVGRYLKNGEMDADTYLNSVNVIDGYEGLQFYKFGLGNNNSALIDENGNVVIVVTYEVEYKFGALPLPFEPKLQITQMVKTKSWLGGYGEGYW